MPKPPRVCERCSAEIGTGPFMTIEATRVGSPRAEARRWLVCVPCGTGAWNWLSAPPVELRTIEAADGRSLRSASMSRSDNAAR